MAKHDPSAPADTTMMRIVHDALRRDLDRAIAVLDAEHAPGDGQRVAIGRHLVWMMHFLAGHHHGEDAGLYPLLRARRPEQTALLDAIEHQHEGIAVGADRLEAAALAYQDDDGDDARRAVAEALHALRGPLFEHLRREEDEAMPIAADCMTRGDWDRIEHEHYLAGKSTRELGLEGHWLIDDASDDDRAIVLGTVSAVPRFVLLHGFARTYRRQRDACWHPDRLRRRVQHEGNVVVEVEAPLDAVWDVVRDPVRVGEWSHECVSAEYLGGATAPAVGVRFRGRNRQGLVRWGRVCEIVTLEPHEIAWRTVPTLSSPDSCRWSIRLSPASAGTRIEQHFEVVKGAPLLEVLYATVLPAHRDRTESLAADLRRIGEVAARSAPLRVSA